MAAVPRALTPAAASRRLAALAPLFVLASGCVTTGLATWGGPPPAPTGTPCQIVASWKSEVMFTPDPAHGGVSSPGIAGRVYLFGPRIDFPFTCDGSLTVDLFAEGAGPEGQPVLVEEWRIDPATLKRLLVHDFVGWGYTVFLPLTNYHPEGMRGHLRTRFEPAGGTPLYTEGAPTVFGPPDPNLAEPVITTQTKTVVPALTPEQSAAPPSPQGQSLPPGGSVRISPR
jgi:hypothetical protein